MTLDLSWGRIAQDYDKWYETPKGVYADDQEKKLFLKLTEFKKGQTLLDIGCGTGHFSFWFHSLGLKVTGIDLSLEMLKVAKSKLKNKEIKFFRGNASLLPFSDDSFDLVVLITTLEFASNPGQILSEAFRVCRSRIFLGVLNKYSILAFKRKLKAYFINKQSVYRKAKFYSLRGLKKLIKKSMNEDKIELCYEKILKGAFIGLVITKDRLKQKNNE